MPAALFVERRDHEVALKNSAYNRQRQAPLHRAYNSRQDVPLVYQYGVTLVFPNFFPNIQSPTPGSRCGARLSLFAVSPDHLKRLMPGGSGMSVSDAPVSFDAVTKPVRPV